MGKVKYNIEEFIGKRFGFLTVVGKDETKPLSNRFLFRCDCGRIFDEEPGTVINGHRTSCGKCEYRKRNSRPNFDINDYIGKKNNKLTVIGLAEKKPMDKKYKLLCQCDCGNFTEITPYQFNSGKTKSCGCLRTRSDLHGDKRSTHPLYGTWYQMISRCENLNTVHFEKYGGRTDKPPIKVCDEWHDFWKFVEWADSCGGKKEGLTVDRIDNDGDYCPENCKWSTQTEQLRNRSNTVFIEYNGKTQTLAEWARETGLSFMCLSHRYQRGWPVERMLTEPVQKRTKPSITKEEGEHQ